MKPLYKVHKVRARIHKHTHIDTAQKPQWLGQEKADVLMVLTNGTWRGGDEPVCLKSIDHPTHLPLTRVFNLRLSRRSHRASSVGTDGQGIKGQESHSSRSC